MTNTSNYQHAAVVLKSLTKATADRFLATLAPELCQQIVMEMRQTHVTASNLREAIERLKLEGLHPAVQDDPVAEQRHGTLKRVGERILRIDDGAEAGLKNSFGQRVGLVPRPNLDFSKAQTVQFQKDPFAFLTRYGQPLLDRLFGELQIRNSAVILSTLPFEFVAEQFQSMKDKQKILIMHAIADLEDLHPAEIIDLKFAVRTRIQQMIKSDPRLKPFPKTTGVQNPLASLSSKPSARMSVNAKVNDPHEGLIASLLEMPDQEIKTLLKTIDTTHLAPALKTCPISLQKKVLSNMAKKPAAILTQQILNVRVDEAHRISSSRKNVANAIKRMQLQQEKAT
jgi:flagellar motor switch protein FliG